MSLIFSFFPQYMYSSSCFTVFTKKTQLARILIQKFKIVLFWNKYTQEQSSINSSSYWHNEQRNNLFLAVTNGSFSLLRRFTPSNLRYEIIDRKLIWWSRLLQLKLFKSCLNPMNYSVGYFHWFRYMIYTRHQTVLYAKGNTSRGTPQKPPEAHGSCTWY